MSSPLEFSRGNSSETSPLLSANSKTAGRFSRPSYGKRKPRGKRESLPLVYTEFRSPESAFHASAQPRSTEPMSNVGSAISSTVSAHSLNRNSQITNLETLSSGAIWLVLLMPVVITYLVFLSTASWKYQTFELTGWSSSALGGTTWNTTSVILPASSGRYSFLRPILTIDGFHCKSNQCNNFHAHVDVGLGYTDDGDRLVQHEQPLQHVHRLLHKDVSVSQYIRTYMAHKVNNSVDIDEQVIIPLPVVHLDVPVFGAGKQQRALFVYLNVSHWEPASTASTIADDNGMDGSNDGDVEVRDENATIALLGTDRRLGTAGQWSSSTPVTFELLTYGDGYTLALTVLQLLLSLISAILLYRTCGAIYHSACMLRDKFTTLEGTNESRPPSYGAIDSTELVLEDVYSVRWWHFVLPEQFTAVFLLFFLCVWQGAIPAVLGGIGDLGWNVSDGWLFVSGLAVTCAQFGVAFCFVVYIDGLKFHTIPPAKLYQRRLSAKKRAARMSTGSSRRSYDPFDAPGDGSTTGDPDDEDSEEFWRRDSLGVKGFTAYNAQRGNDLLTPLEREYKQAMSLFVTYHHPSSVEFIGFIHRKFIFLLISWTVSVLYWLLMYPRIWHSRALSSIQVQSVEERAWALELLLALVGLGWLYFLVQTCIITGARLRRTKLVESRFRQVAFRTLMLQVNIGLLLLIISVAWYVWTEHFFVNIRYGSVEAMVSYVFMRCAHYGLFHVDVVMNPPLSVHNAELLLFVSALVYSTVHCMLPPDAAASALSKRSEQALVMLERHDPTLEQRAHVDAKDREIVLGALRQHLVEEEYRRFMSLYLPRALKRHPAQHFCLETALIYLEVSYQTYFSAQKKLPTSELGRTAPSHITAPTIETRATAKKSTNPFDDDAEETCDAPYESSNIEGLNFGPKIDLSGLGYELRKTFSCEKYTTFGFLCESRSTGKVLVSFRGSLLGNAVANMKFAQIALPPLKRSRSYFTELIRRFSIERADDDLDASEAGAARTPTSELIPERDPQESVLLPDEFAELCEHVESGDVDEEEGMDFLPPVSEASGALEDTQLAKNLRKVSTKIPIVNQGFKRVHAGFWESYASIREEYLCAIVHAMFEYKKKLANAVRASSAVSPGNSWHEEQAASIARQGGTPSAVDGIRALLTSPLMVKNPFSPLFSPPTAPTENGSQAPPAASPRTPSNLISSTSGVIDLPELEIVFCGHSLGAAIASLAALELVENMAVIMEAFALEECFNVPRSQGLMRIPAVLSFTAPKTSLFTYGSPRVGNAKFASAITKKVDTVFRVLVNGDVVTMMPKLVGFYRHFGTTVIVDEEESGSIIIDPTIIERSILQKSTGSVANHSLDRYRSCLEACFEPAELDEYLEREFRGLAASGKGRRGEAPDWVKRGAV